MSGPDFIATGLAPGATGWLRHQLRHHPAAWLPPIEELPRPGAARPAPRARSGRGAAPADEADRRFLALLDRLAPDEAPSLDAYLGLFAPGAGRLTGDVARAHARPAPATVEALVAARPGLRAVIVVDDPVALAWAGLRRGVARGLLTPAVLSDPAALAREVPPERLRRQNAPGRALRAWSRLVPCKALVMADLRERPEAAREEVARFLGLDPSAWGRPATEGLDEGEPAPAMPPAIAQALAGQLAEEIRRVAALLGGEAATWPARHGLGARAPAVADAATERLDRELDALRAGGESVSFAQFYARTALKAVEAGKAHKTLGPRLMGVGGGDDGDWTRAGRERHDLLVASAGLGATPFRVVDYGCGSLRVGQHFIRELPAGHYLGLDVIDEFYRMGVEMLGAEVVADKRPDLGLIGEAAAEARAEALGADLVCANAVAFHVHPDEFATFAANLDRFSRKPGAVVLFDAMIFPEAARYAHRGWARPIEAYLAALPGLEFRGVRESRDDPRDGREMVMQLLEFRRPG